MMRFSAVRAGIAAALIASSVGVSAGSATAATTLPYRLFAGYADCPTNPAVGCAGAKITNPAFPFPWYPHTGWQFVGDSSVYTISGNDPDTSAIRVQNTTANPLTINDVSVSGCGGGLDLWGTSPFAYPYTVPAHGQIVLTSTSGDNFDGSDGCSAGAVVVNVNINGVTASYPDKIANNGNGAIFGASSYDESTPWTKLAGSKTTVQFRPSSLPAATSGTSYRQQLWVDSTNGAPTFSIPSTSTPPPGLTLSPTGLLSGTPSTPGKYTFTVKVADTAKPVDTGTKSYTLKVS